MSHATYWGKDGQFGPFESQDDGWPNAGQVMRYFREKRGITAKAFGKLYGKQVKENGKAICERWILEMELENKVPIDITRRRIIACLLDIPPLLFGLASLENIVMNPQKVTGLISTATSSTLQKVSTDTTKYEKDIRIALNFHRTSHALNLLQEVNTNIQGLESLAAQAEGDLLYKAGELLISNRLLATKIVKDQRQYALAYLYANDAVQMAKKIEDHELLAATKYTRGCVNLEWGLFGTLSRGRFHMNHNKIKDAIHDFQEILHKVRSQHISLHPQLSGFTMLQLSRAQGILNQSEHGLTSVNALTLAEQAKDMVGCNSIEDPYTRLLVTGTLSGLHMGGYHLIKAGIFNSVGLAGKAISELNQLKCLTEQTYGKDETRNQAWSDIAMSEALMGLKEYQEATNKTKDALIACHHINSLQNITTIIDLHSRLVASPYGKSRDVKELGAMLKYWYEDQVDL